MKIAVIVKWYSDGMGYAENLLPPALARAGAEVYVLAGNVNVYFGTPLYKDVYEALLGPGEVPTGVSTVDGVSIERLPHRWYGRSLGFDGLSSRLAALRPDVIQTFVVQEPATWEAARYAARAGAAFFTGCHVHASTVPRNLGGRLHVGVDALAARALPDRRRVNTITERCYAIGDDVALVARRLYGVPRRACVVQSLGVNTQLFRPMEWDAAAVARRNTTRDRLGIPHDAVVCIYTGRFSQDKDPACLAKAVAMLQQAGHPYRALFVGTGPVDYRERLRDSQGCTVHPFAQARELAELYHAADIGVWPREESTSQLDALACGLPVVLSANVSVRERVDGCGRTYREGDAASLSEALLGLRDQTHRAMLGSVGAARVRERFSWDSIARSRLSDYEAALSRGPRSSHVARSGQWARNVSVWR